jgi:Tol biopolymer transport system component
MFNLIVKSGLALFVILTTVLVIMQTAANQIETGRALVYESGRDIYVALLDSADRLNLTYSRDFEDAATWTPDGERILYYAWSHTGETHALYTMTPIGRDKTELVTLDLNASQRIITLTYSPDGKQIAYRVVGVFGSSLRVMNADGSDQRQLIRMEGQDYFLEWSPDGDQLLYINEIIGLSGAALARSIHTIDVETLERTDVTNFLDEITRRSRFVYAAKWADDGRILFVERIDTEKALYAVNPDGTNLEHLRALPERTSRPIFWHDESLIFPVYIGQFGNAVETQRFNTVNGEVEHLPLGVGWRYSIAWRP